MTCHCWMAAATRPAMATRTARRSNDSRAYAHASGGQQADYGDLGIDDSEIPF